MLFETLVEYDSEIEIVRQSIRRQLMLGKDRSHSSGGSSRSESEIDMDAARDYLNQLQKERAMLDPATEGCGGAFRVGAGW